MRQLILLPILLVAALLSPRPPAAGASVVRSPDTPVYRVHLTSGTIGHVWVGDETLSFRNAGTTDLSTIYLRLWSNGVRGCRAQNAIEISDVVGGTAQAPTQDCTAVRVDLDSPVPSGERASIGMGLRIEVSARNDRFGYHGGLALFGTALPTLAIHDDAGWHLDPFVDIGESFYSLVGRYHVSMEMPKRVAVVTTGVATRRTTSPDGRHAATYVATDVRDFEWASGPLRHVEARVGATRVVVSYLPSMIGPGVVKRALDHATSSLLQLGRAFGTFPYPEMDVVLTEFKSFSGMEYPTIIFANPDRYSISHELAHQWWYGIVGDDQFGEPWLDESFATWSQFLPYGGWTNCPSYRFPSTTARITNDMAYWLTHSQEYDTIYGGGGCLLANLAHRFGYTTFLHILHRYAADHWLGIARTEDFMAAIDAAAARRLPDLHMDAFWAGWRVT